jgi:hypothetical protein
MICFRMTHEDGTPLVLTVDGAILVADSEEEAHRVGIPEAWECVPFETLDWGEHVARAKAELVQLHDGGSGA